MPFILSVGRCTSQQRLHGRWLFAIADLGASTPNLNSGVVSEVGGRTEVPTAKPPITTPGANQMAHTFFV